MLSDQFKSLITGKVADVRKAVTVRKSSEPTTVQVIDRPFSIAKYLRGAANRGWAGADMEKKMYFEVNKTLSEGIGTAGGFLVPPEYSRELIELLRASAVIRSLNPLILPISSDTINIPRQTGAGTAYWVEEDETKTASDQTFGQLKLVLKEVAGLTRVSNNLLEDSSPAVDAIIKNDLVKVLQLAEDLAFIAGTGGAQPLGLMNNPAISSVILGTPDGASPTADDFSDAMYAIEAANATYTAWVMHPRTKNSLRKLKDADGNYIFTKGDINKKEPDTIWGVPIAYSTQIPITRTVGANTDCSYAILGNWGEFVIAQKSGATIKLAISDQEGNSFEKDRTAIRATLRVDGAARQPAAFYVVDGIRP